MPRLINDEFQDYFTEDAPEEEQPKEHVETEQEREEREIQEATIERRGRSLRLALLLIIIAMAAFLGWWIWQYYFHPYNHSQEKGWIMKVNNEGSLFKTYEGEMITEKYIEDTIVAMHSNFFFTIPTDSLAREAMRWAGNGQRVILTYDEYKGKVFWRGSTNRLVVAIERDSDRVMPAPPHE